MKVTQYFIIFSISFYSSVLARTSQELENLSVEAEASAEAYQQIFDSTFHHRFLQIDDDDDKEKAVSPRTSRAPTTVVNHHHIHYTTVNLYPQAKYQQPQVCYRWWDTDSWSFKCSNVPAYHYHHGGYGWTGYLGQGDPFELNLPNTSRSESDRFSRIPFNSRGNTKHNSKFNRRNRGGVGLV